MCRSKYCFGEERGQVALKHQSEIIINVDITMDLIIFKDAARVKQTIYGEC